MKFSIKLVLPLLFIFLSYSSSSMWGPTGHRVVGEIAENHLTKKARKAIHKILGDESLAMSTNWADFIKSDTAFSYLSPWHYVNIRQGLNYEDFKDHLQKDSVTDAYTKLNFLIRELENKDLDAGKKIMYLKMLVHITGDVHQPMHVGKSEDQGGNKIKVFWFSEPTNLHSVWDDKLIEFQKLSYTEFAKAVDHSTREQCINWQQEPIEQWFYESYIIAGQLYNEITQPDQKLSYRYNFDHVGTLEDQLLKGGIRLAGLLNRIFG